MFNYFGLAQRKTNSAATGDKHPVHPGWPEATPQVILPPSTTFRRGARLRLRPLMHSDGEAWRATRLIDESWLRPVEPTPHGGWEETHSAPSWRQHFSFIRRAAQEGSVVPLVIDVDGEFAGQVTLGNIQHGGVRECWVGYWVHSVFMGGGVATAACALGVDHAFARVGLHRVTATYMPSNPASGAVLKTNGFREEGYLRRNLHINGRWEDHHLMALNRDDFPTTCVGRLRAAGRVVD